MILDRRVPKGWQLRIALALACAPFVDIPRELHTFKGAVQHLGRDGSIIRREYLGAAHEERNISTRRAGMEAHEWRMD